MRAAKAHSAVRVSRAPSAGQVSVFRKFFEKVRLASLMAKVRRRTWKSPRLKTFLLLGHSVIGVPCTSLESPRPTQGSSFLLTLLRFVSTKEKPLASSQHP